MIRRKVLVQSIQRALRRSRVVALLGPRQAGKTTLARQFEPHRSPNYFDLEDPLSAARLEQPMTALEPLRGTVVIDEIQRRPDLFPILRVLADRQGSKTRFLILGSASPSLIKQSSESLAGRTEIVPIPGFSLAELSPRTLPAHWLRGGFPLSFLATSDEDSFIWRRDFIRTMIERDLPQMGVSASALLLTRFWTMLAHLHGQVWNAAEPARSLGIGETTVRRYLDVLSGLFMVRQLQPWHANLGKRQIKAPKVYFHDTGLLHQLLGIRTVADLTSHPRSGASWEGYAIEEILKVVKPDEAYFWGTHNGAELDLLIIKHGKRYGIECKRADSPRMSPSIRTALVDLKLNHVWVVYPGNHEYSLDDKVRAVPLTKFLLKPPPEIA